MLKPQLIEPDASFFASASTSRSKLLVNLGGRIPVRVRLQQTRGIKARLVKPEKLRSSIRSDWRLQDLVESSQGSIAIRLLFQANALLEQRLIVPVAGVVGAASKLIVSLNGSSVVFGIARA